jgi:hypothetical protein
MNDKQLIKNHSLTNPSLPEKVMQAAGEAKADQPTTHPLLFL